MALEFVSGLVPSGTHSAVPLSFFFNILYFPFTFVLSKNAYTLDLSFNSLIISLDKVSPTTRPPLFDVPAFSAVLISSS